MSNGSLPDTKYWRRFRGPFSGVLKWLDVDSLWAGLKSSPTDWYVFDPAGHTPETPLDKAGFLRFLEEAEELVNQRRDRPSCGAVYLDQPENPAYIKIFDPAHMGTSCSCSDTPVMPRWIVSHMMPDALPQPPIEKPSIFQRLTRRL